MPLLSLPNELLFEIFEEAELTQTDLGHLRQVHSRLDKVVRPRVLKKVSIDVNKSIRLTRLYPKIPGLLEAVNGSATPYQERLTLCSRLKHVFDDVGLSEAIRHSSKVFIAAHERGGGGDHQIHDQVFTHLVLAIAMHGRLWEAFQRPENITLSIRSLNSRIEAAAHLLLQILTTLPQKPSLRQILLSNAPKYESETLCLGYLNRIPMDMLNGLMINYRIPVRRQEATQETLCGFIRDARGLKWFMPWIHSNWDPNAITLNDVFDGMTVEEIPDIPVLDIVLTAGWVSGPNLQKLSKSLTGLRIFQITRHTGDSGFIGQFKQLLWHKIKLERLYACGPHITAFEYLQWSENNIKDLRLLISPSFGKILAENYFDSTAAGDNYQNPDDWADNFWRKALSALSHSLEILVVYPAEDGSKVIPKSLDAVVGSGKGDPVLSLNLKRLAEENKDFSFMKPLTLDFVTGTEPFDLPKLRHFTGMCLNNESHAIVPRLFLKCGNLKMLRITYAVRSVQFTSERPSLSGDSWAEMWDDNEIQLEWWIESQVQVSGKPAWIHNLVLDLKTFSFGDQLSIRYRDDARYVYRRGGFRKVVA